MKLNKKSWHKKAHSMVYRASDYPKNGCKYFKQLIWSMIVMSFVVLSAVGVVFGAPALPLVGPNAFHDLTIWNYFLSFTSLWGGFAALVAIMVYLSNAYDDRQIRKWNKGVVPAKPSIFKEYVKAKIGRYCPRIEWK